MIMDSLSRRTFVGMSLGSVSAICMPQPAAAAGAPAQCVTGGLQFLPNRLTVSCASRRNFRAFRHVVQLAL